LPKPLHPLAGRPLLEHVLERARALAPQRLIVVTSPATVAIRERYPHADWHWALQAEPDGTGGAVRAAQPLLPEQGRVLILYGDVPLLPVLALRALQEESVPLALLSVRTPEPQGYGRVIRGDDGQVLRIVEEADASDGERRVDEVNTGVMCVQAELLARLLPRVRNDNRRGEFYLTDLVGLAVAEGVAVKAVCTEDHRALAGVNTRAQLAQLERRYQRDWAEAQMAAGVSFADPARVDCRGRLLAEPDVWVDVNVVFEGEVRLGRGVRIGAGCVLRDCVLADGVELLPFCHLDGVRVAQGARVGPYARLRPGTEIGAGAHIGNFVELKNTRFGAGSKAGHLAYLGDSDIGREANIGAGVITCNYDGTHKHRTTVGDGVFIGSDSQLIAPVVVGTGAYVAAGSSIHADVPPDALGIARARQENKPGWAARRRRGGPGAAPGRQIGSPPPA